MSVYQCRMLTAEQLVQYRSKVEKILPTCGKKEFVPSGSWLESKQVQSALDDRKELLLEERVERICMLAEAEWDEELVLARVTRRVGRHFEMFGHEVNQTLFLYPEEALFLIENNHLELLYGGVAMSLQQGYSTLLSPKADCTLDEYRVFSQLQRQGHRLLRHSSIFKATRYERQIGLPQYSHPYKEKKVRKESIVKNKVKVETQEVIQLGNEVAESNNTNSSVKKEPVDIKQEVEILDVQNNYSSKSHHTDADPECVTVDTEIVEPSTTRECCNNLPLINTDIEQINVSDDEYSPELQCNSNNKIISRVPESTNVLHPGVNQSITSDTVSQQPTIELINCKKENNDYVERVDVDNSCDRDNDSSIVSSSVQNSNSEKNYFNVTSTNVEENNHRRILSTSPVVVKIHLNVAKNKVVSQQTCDSSIVDSSVDDTENVCDPSKVSSSVCDGSGKKTNSVPDIQEVSVDSTSSKTHVISHGAGWNKKNNENQNCLDRSNGKKASEVFDVADGDNSVNSNVIKKEHQSSEVLDVTNDDGSAIKSNDIKQEHQASEVCDVTDDYSPIKQNYIKQEHQASEVFDVENDDDPAIKLNTNNESQSFEVFDVTDEDDGDNDNDSSIKANIKQEDQSSEVFGITDDDDDDDSTTITSDGDDESQSSEIFDITDDDDSPVKADIKEESQSSEVFDVTDDDDDSPITLNVELESQASKSLDGDSQLRSNIKEEHRQSSHDSLLTRKVINDTIGDELACQSSHNSLLTTKIINDTIGDELARDNVQPTTSVNSLKRKHPTNGELCSKSNKRYLMDNMIRSTATFVVIDITDDEENGDTFDENTVKKKESVERRSSNNNTIKVENKMSSDLKIEEELSKFYEEIELIDLAAAEERKEVGEDWRTIIDSFPNASGQFVVNVTVPPSRLLPPNVCPNQSEYNIQVWRLKAPGIGGIPDRIVESPYPRRTNHYHGHNQGHFRNRPKHFSRRHFEFQNANTTHANTASPDIWPREMVQPWTNAEISINYHHQNPVFHAAEVTYNVLPPQLYFPVIPHAMQQHWQQPAWTHDERHTAREQQQFVPRNNTLWHGELGYRRNIHDIIPRRMEEGNQLLHHAQQHQQQERQTRHYGHQRGFSNHRGNSQQIRKNNPFLNRNGAPRFNNPRYFAPPRKLQSVMEVISNEERPEAAIKSESQSSVEDSDEEEIEALVKPADCSNTDNILNKLQIIRCANLVSTETPPEVPILDIRYDLYLPDTVLRKSNPSLPDFRLAVIGYEQPIPSPGRIAMLLREYRDTVPLLLAVVLPDAVTFFHYSSISLPAFTS